MKKNHPPTKHHGRVVLFGALVPAEEAGPGSTRSVLLPSTDYDQGMSERSIPWYRRYPAILDDVKQLREQFDNRCRQLGSSPEVIANGFRREFLIRAVYESNWQEGIELEFGRTKELADLAMDDLRFHDGSRLDLEGVVEMHRRQILNAKRGGASIAEIATSNLARAHVVLIWICDELEQRQAASLVSALQACQSQVRAASAAQGFVVPPSIQRAYEIIEGLLTDGTSVGRPVTGGVAKDGELLDMMLSADFDTLVNPMDARYLHGLHRLTMMGVVSSSALGRWRRSPVHVGNPEIDFPTPDAIPGLMSEFCRSFPAILRSTTKYEPIMMAAKISYGFVRIHPYLDGNGRMSRLLMNLLLLPHHPIVVSLAPKAKERHRYREAIRRADRGSLEPMATLIAISICDSYRRMLSALMADPR